MLGRLIGVVVLLGWVRGGVLTAQHRSSTIRTAKIAIDLGFLSASGNANASMLNFGERVDLKTREDRLRFSQWFRAMRSRADHVEGLDSYRIQLRGDYRLTESIYAMAIAGWERDLRAGLRNRWQATVGAAWEWTVAPADILTFEAGASAFRQRSVVLDSAGLDGRTMAGHLAGRFRHIFSKDTYFAQSVELAPNFTVSGGFRTVTESEAAARVSSIVSLKLMYLILYTNRPGLDAGSLTGERLAKLDRIFTAGFSFSF